MPKFRNVNVLGFAEGAIVTVCAPGSHPTPNAIPACQIDRHVANGALVPVAEDTPLSEPLREHLDLPAVMESARTGPIYPASYANREITEEDYRAMRAEIKSEVREEVREEIRRQVLESDAKVKEALAAASTPPPNVEEPKGEAKPDPKPTEPAKPDPKAKK